MFTKRRLMAYTAVIAVLGVTAAYAAGNWSTLPQVGMSSFCASNVSGVTLPTAQGAYGVVPGSTQGTGFGICGQTVPAGPTAVTGSEIIPADTQLTGSAPPQTVAIPMPLMASGAYFDNVQSSYTTTATIPNNVNVYMMDTTTTIAGLTLTMPATPINGQVVRVGSVKTITALTMLANAGQTIIGTSPTALTPSATAAVGYAWVWNSTTTDWERLQ